MFGNLGMSELLILLVIILVLFGAKRLPEIGGSLGKGIREFKSSIKDVQSEMKEIGSAEQPRGEQEPREAEKEKTSRS
jgi:sec-independent protein translocase protein TatA